MGLAAPDTPPTITINSDNPVIITVGDSYADLGATVSDMSQVATTQATSTQHARSKLRPTHHSASGSISPPPTFPRQRPGWIVERCYSVVRHAFKRAVAIAKSLQPGRVRSKKAFRAQ